MQRIQRASGLLIRQGEERSFIGSCFAYRRPDVFLTAYHCVEHVPVHELAIGLPAVRDALNAPLNVLGVVPHPTADVAVAFVEPIEVQPPYWMAPVDHASDWGESVVCFGYPDDSTPNGVMPTPRMSNGNIQRFFDYADGRGEYRALELSFPSPQGLSGSPLCRTQDTGAPIAVITANHNALTYRGGFEVSEDGVTYLATERDVIRYAIAAYLPDIEEWLQAEMGGEAPS